MTALVVCRLCSNRLPESRVETKRASKTLATFPSRPFPSRQTLVQYSFARAVALRTRTTVLEEILRTEWPVNLALDMRSAAARMLACSRPGVRPCCEDDNFALFRQPRRDRYHECGPGSERPCDKSEWSPTASSLLSVLIAALRSGTHGSVHRPLYHPVQEPELTAARVRPTGPDRRARLARVRGTCLREGRLRGCRPLRLRSGSRALAMTVPHSA